MKKNAKKAILKILLLQEEFTKNELSEAVKFISDNSEDDILSYLTSKKAIGDSPKKVKKSITDQTSKAVIELKERDIEKYHLLKKFDTHLRNKELLPRLDSIKKLGSRFSKEFVAGKSRKEAIPKLMSLLADVSIEDLKRTVTNVIDESGHASNEYADLANYIIHGSSQDALNKANSADAKNRAAD